MTFGDRSHGRLLIRPLSHTVASWVCAATLALLMVGPAHAQLLPRHRPVRLGNHVLRPGDKVDARGKIVADGTARGCFVVRLVRATGPILACRQDVSPIPVGTVVMVHGKVTGITRRRDGPFLDFIPVVRGMLCIRAAARGATRVSQRKGNDAPAAPWNHESPVPG